MKSFMFLLALGLVSTEKLDRTYLPPPGSKYSGGSAGDLQVPLEFPKETYTTSAPSTPGQKVTGLIPSGDKRITVGIDRGTGLPRIPGEPQDVIPVTSAFKSTFNSFQNTYKVPTTTTSYAFTQTTTLAPVEGIETTISPLGPRIPIDGAFGQQLGLVGFPQPTNQGQFSQQIGQSQPGVFQPGNQIVSTPSSMIPGYQSAIPSGPTSIDGHPGYNSQPQNFNQYQQGLLSSTSSPISGNEQPGFRPSYNQGYTKHLGVQPPNQPSLVNDQGTFPSTVAAPGYHPGATSQYNDQISNQGILTPGSNISLRPSQTIGQQGPYSTPGFIQPGVSEYVDNFGNVQQVIPGSTLTQQVAGQPQAIGQQIPFTPSGYPEYSTDFIQPNATPGLFEIQQGQHPQYIDQQSTLSPTGSPLGSIVPSVTGTQQQFRQGPQSVGEQGIYPSTGISPGKVTGSFIPEQQPQFSGQHAIFPSTTAKGLPANYAENNLFGGYDNNVPGAATTGSNIPQIISDQQPISGIQSGIQNNLGPYGHTQITDGRFPNQQNSRPGNQAVVSGGPQYGYRADTTAPSPIAPFGINQQAFPSTTPSSPTYGTTPVGVYPSTPGYPSYVNQERVPSINITHRPERPQAESDKNAVILNYENVRSPDGYAYSFDTSNGIHGDENGTAIGGVRANGSYSYIGDDGKLYSVVYSADENGFRPHGDHIPTPPPVPEAIQKVIEQAERDKEAGITHDGFYDEAKYGHKKYQGPKHNRTQIHGEITNGADIPDDNEPGLQGKVSMDRYRSYGGRLPATSQNGESSEEYEELDIDIKDQSGGSVKVGKYKKRPYNKTPPQRHMEKKPESDKYDDQNIRVDDTRKPTGSRIYDRTQTTTNKNHYSYPRKQYPSQDAFRGNQDEYEETEDFENGTDKKYDRNNKIPSKSSGSKYESEGKPDFTHSYDSKEHIVTGSHSHSTRRPGSQNSHYEDTDVTSAIHGTDRKLQKQMRGPSKTYGTKYSVSGDNGKHFYQEPPGAELEKDGKTITSRPENYKRPGETLHKQTNQRPEINFQEGSYDDNLDYSDDVRLEQKGQSYDQKPQIGDSKYPQQQLDEETGYQYTPPQNKFDKVETTRFPSRIGGESDGSRTTLKPFITPNVYSDEDESYEEGSEERLPQRKTGKKPGKGTPTSTLPENVYNTDSDSEYYDKDSDQDIGDEEITTTKVHPGKFGLISSTRRPLYRIKETTGRPQYDEQYTETDEGIMTQKRPVRPGQNGGNQYYVNQKTKGRRPGHDYNQRTPEGTKTSGYNFVSSTTPMPNRGTSTTRISSKRPEYLQEDGQSQYPTTYETSDTSNPEDDYEGSTGPTQTAGSISRKPSTKPGTYIETTAPTSALSKSISRIPSRPRYDHTDMKKAPEFTYTTTKVPILRGSSTKLGENSQIYPASPEITPGTTVVQSSRPTSAPVDGYFYQNQPGLTFIPGSTLTSGRTEYPDRTVSGSVTSIPSGTSRLPGQLGSQDLPSTTYRPNYSITDITQPGTANVDGFGRPITRPSQEVSGNTRTPGVTGTTVPSTSIYQDTGSITPGQSGGKSTFSPGETRFGQPELVSTPSSTSYPGQKPAEFGPSGFTTPGYLGPYSTTERVVGEDFSGPKQPQRFDPQSGYYYKK